MTIAAAIKIKGKVWVGSDSFWGSCYHQDFNSSPTKLIQFDGFIVALAGSSNLRDVLETMVKEYDTVIETKDDARTFVREMWKLAKELHDEGNAKPEDKEQSHSQGAVIIATPNSIFCVQPDLSVFDQDKYDTIGAGDSIAEAVIVNELLKGNSNGKLILEQALRTACTLSPLCQEPIIIKRVK